MALNLAIKTKSIFFSKNSNLSMVGGFYFAKKAPKGRGEG